MARTSCPYLHTRHKRDRRECPLNHFTSRLPRRAQVLDLQTPTTPIPSKRIFPSNFRVGDLGPARTKVQITHLGFTEQAATHTDRAEEYKQVRAYFANAWPHVLTALKQKWEPSTLRVEPVKKLGRSSEPAAAMVIGPLAGFRRFRIVCESI